ncbi:MAG: hypothetical protein JETT_3101 [Candidatus Jettenia ecosi]|uniref:Transposase n=1 Tax=Candidatus Jettenia ecosi TaxID=2494326 RepID=A0A533Q7M9_9BACT|nr:MAG: hypothetical protein JETT_3101 [Candidatus Jettenia ecosi]
MSEYRRLYRQQGWYFFTVVTYNREKILIQPDNSYTAKTIIQLCDEETSL